jgi:spore maturation protein CgeB
VVKVLYLPINSHDSAQTGMYDAWKAAGVELQIFDFFVRWLDTRNAKTVNTEFLQAVTKFQPDLVHMQLQLTGVIDPLTIRQARLACKKNTIFTNWSGDVRSQASPYIVSISKEVDYTFLSSTGQIPLYQKAGAENVRYWQIGYDPKQFFPQCLPATSLKYKLIFTGNAYAAGTFADCGLRQDILLKLKKHFGNSFGLFGSGYPSSYGKIQSISGSAVNNEFNKSHCILSISNYNDISHYFSDRLLVCLASGRPTISYRFPSYDSYFANGSDILIANSVENIINQVEYCVANPQAALQIGMNGFRKVLSEHTYTSRVRELLDMLNLK